MEIRNGRNRPTTAGQVRYLRGLVSRSPERARAISLDLFGRDVTAEGSPTSFTPAEPLYQHTLNAQQASDYIDALTEGET